MTLGELYVMTWQKQLNHYFILLSFSFLFFSYFELTTQERSIGKYHIT